MCVLNPHTQERFIESWCEIAALLVQFVVCVTLWKEQDNNVFKMSTLRFDTKLKPKIMSF